MRELSEDEKAVVALARDADEVADTPGPTTSATAESGQSASRFVTSFDGNSLLPHEPTKSANKSPWFSQSGPNSRGKLAWWEPASRHFVQEILAPR